MGNWYRVTKKIHGRFYDYWQRTERRGKHVKTFNKYIGPTMGRLPGIYGRMERDFTIYATPNDFVVVTLNKPNHFATSRDAAQFIENEPEKAGYTTTAAQAISQMQRHFPTQPRPNYHSLTTDQKKALLKPLGRFPVAMPNEPTGTKVLIRSLDLPNNYVVDTIKEAQFPDGTNYRYVEFNKPYTQRDAMEKLDPWHNPDGVDLRKAKRAAQLQIWDNESVKYGSARKARQAAAVRKVQRETRGIQKLNPFLGKAIKKKDGPAH
jgi:hypothetical protein